jgi:hypothetical protein
MIELRKRYLELKQKATELLLQGKVNDYIKLLTEIEQMNLILVKVNK